jgi:hypothetical protein
MSTQDEAQLIARSQRVLTVIWAAFIFGAVVYMLLGTFLASNSNPDNEASGLVNSVPLHMIFVALSLAEIALLFFLPQFLLGEVRLKAALAKGPTREILARAGLGEPTPRLRALLVLLNQYSTSMIVIWAIAESIAIYGLILTIITSSTTWIYPFPAVAIAVLALRRPRVPDFVHEHRLLLH